MAPLPLGLTRARPRLGARERVVGSAAASWAAKGLSRQASRMTIGDARLGLDVAQEIGEREGAVFHRELVLDVDVDGEDVVLVADLDAVAGVEQHRGIGALQVLREVGDGREQLVLRRVVGGEDGEAEPLERLRDRLRVVHGVGERDRFLIRRVADDERDAAFLGSGGGDEEEQENSRQSEETRRKSCHRDPSSLATTASHPACANCAYRISLDGDANVAKRAGVKIFSFGASGLAGVGASG